VWYYTDWSVKLENYFVILSRGKTSFLLQAGRLALGPFEPPIQWVLGALFPGAKQSGCETGNSLLPRTDVNLYLTSPYDFMVCTGTLCLACAPLLIDNILP